MLPTKPRRRVSSLVTSQTFNISLSNFTVATGTEGTVVSSGLAVLPGATANFSLGLAVGRLVVITLEGNGSLQLGQVVVNTDKAIVSQRFSGRGFEPRALLLFRFEAQGHNKGHNFLPRPAPYPPGQ